MFIKTSLVVCVLVALLGVQTTTAVKLKYFDLELSWSDAFKICEIDGGHIYVPYEEDSYNALCELLDENGSPDKIWAGFFTLKNNAFIALNGHDKDDVLGILSNVENQEGRRNCGVVTDAGRYKYISNCLVKRTFVCSYPETEAPCQDIP